jgi:predicted PolB exonuclease-like 3'-5' exonuclease
MIPTLVFDIETIPDTQGLQKILGLPAETSAEEIANVAFHQRRQHNGIEFLALQHHRVIAISCVLRDSNGLRVWSLGSPEESEAQLIQRFFEGIERYTPNLVSWNGNGFDLPVLHYRALINQVTAARYWDMGEQDRDFKFNNYISRYHTRHLDLMDLLALYQARANAPLDEIAQLCGFPGKLGMDGSQVWSAYQQGQIHAIRNYCETDVVNTFLVYLRFELMRGVIDQAKYQQEINLVQQTLAQSEGAHWQEFLAAWQAHGANVQAGLAATPQSTGH